MHKFHSKSQNIYIYIYIYKKKLILSIKEDELS